MNYYKIIFNWLWAVLLLAALTSCGDDEDIQPDSLAQLPTTEQADAEGNLVIRNYSDAKLVLYRMQTGEPIKVIPNSTEDFLVAVTVSGNPIVDLGIFLYKDVQHNPSINGLDSIPLFVRWNVALPAEMKDGQRVLWVITADSKLGARGENQGEVRFFYPGGTDYQVDVRLDFGPFGDPKALIPGNEFIAKLDYGTYTAAYHYFSSDQNDTNPFKEVGTITSTRVNDEEVPITVVLNDNSPSRDVIIPHYELFGNGEEGAITYGKLQVKNKKATPITIFYGNQKLIENILYNPNGSSNDNAATIDANETVTFIIPIGYYDFTASYWNDPTTIAALSTEIKEEETTVWEVR